MELIHTFLNIVAPPTSFFTLCLFLPPFLFFKFMVSTLRSIFSENLEGKVVLITGASSGIGENLAYEYARRGAHLVLVARRENRLQQVADRAREYGTDVHVVCADVAKVDDCKRIIDEAVNHFGRLDHLVNNAGISSLSMFEDLPDVRNNEPIMDINFWGSVYPTHFAIPHLRQSRGKIVVMSSSAGWLPAPRMSLYNASKAALINFFDTLRVEFGSSIRITIVTPGFIESELTQGKFLGKEGNMEMDQEMRDVQIGPTPVLSAQSCAKGIVNSVCRGQRYVTEPAWFKITYLWRVFCPEAVDLVFRLLYITGPGASQRDSLNKRILDVTGSKSILYPASIQSPELKTD